MAANPSRFKGPELPVENVSWTGAAKYCESVSPRLSLPTEAQWEYACRAGTETLYAFGESIDATQVSHKSESSATGDARSRVGAWTLPVGSFPPNGFGLHDLHGNVWEWCDDVYDEEFYRRSEATRKNPRCEKGSSFRVFRGGAWHNKASACRAAVRSGGDPVSYHNGGLGFRPVYVPER